MTEAERTQPIPTASPYLQRILRARVYDVAIESPLELAPILSARLDNRVWLKREDLQPVFSFKGTIGLEILRQSSEPPDAIYVAVGGGGLIAGIAAYVKSLWPAITSGSSKGWMKVRPRSAARRWASRQAAS